MKDVNKRSRGVRENNNHQDDDEDEAEVKRWELNNSNGNRMTPWHYPSSRIYRVSRASGGKDRHSKVYTSKGLRDRRVRLSVSTAIQFYDLQDRLGYDQPSKAIEWLIKAAQSAIDELPSLDINFPEPMDQNLNVENRLMVSDSVMDHEAEPSYNQQQHSSTSETSRGSVLSLSRSEIRVKARERAKERVKGKEKDRDDVHVGDHQGLNTQGSFTKLLTGGSNTSSGGGQASSSASFIQMHHNLPPVSATADLFNTQAGFSSQAHFGMVPLMSNGGNHSNEMQQFAFMHDHFFPVATVQAEGDYNLNFSISPGFAGFHRGTLQSNSPSHHHHHHHQLHLSHHHNHNNHHQVQAQRLSLALDGSSVPVPLFFGTAANAAAAANNENHYSSGFDGNLQLDAYKNLELNGKGKS